MNDTDKAFEKAKNKIETFVYYIKNEPEKSVTASVMEGIYAEEDFNKKDKPREYFNAGVEYGRAKPVIQPMETAPKDGTDFLCEVIDGQRFMVSNDHGGDIELNFRNPLSNYPIYLRYQDCVGWIPTPKMTHE